MSTACLEIQDMCSGIWIKELVQGFELPPNWHNHRGNQRLQFRRQLPLLVAFWGQNKEILSVQDMFILFVLIWCCLLKGSYLRLGYLLSVDALNEVLPWTWEYSVCKHLSLGWHSNLPFKKLGFLWKDSYLKLSSTLTDFVVLLSAGKSQSLVWMD